MRFVRKKREQGSVLVISMVTCMVIATVLASYLAMISTRYSLTVRSMDWNAAIPVLEAGVEEALTHLHDDVYPTANGWTNGTYAGQAVVSKTRTFTDGSYAKVHIANAASVNPIIYSQGFVPAPLGKGYIRRAVRVTAAKAITVTSGGIAANGLITLSGGATIDSYSSCLGAYSTNNWHGTNASVQTNSQLKPAIKVDTAHVYGTVNTGPVGTVSIGGGAVGDVAWNATSSGIQPGWSDYDMNVAFPSNAPPPLPYTPMPLPTVIGGSNITYLPSGTFSAASFTSSDSTKPMFVTGNAILYLTGNLTVQGSGYIKIFPGASLTLYTGGNNNVVSGGGVVNGTQQPANFTFFGTKTNTKITVSGSGVFIGTINAPQAALTISGSGGMFGAAIVNTYTGSGGSSFHYDECLNAPNAGLLTLTSWVEL